MEWDGIYEVFLLIYNDGFYLMKFIDYLIIPFDFNNNALSLIIYSWFLIKYWIYHFFMYDQEFYVIVDELWKWLLIYSMTTYWIN